MNYLKFDKGDERMDSVWMEGIDRAVPGIKYNYEGGNTAQIYKFIHQILCLYGSSKKYNWYNYLLSSRCKY